LIKKRYDEYIIDPQVSVSLDRDGSYRYSVIGDVAQPGIKFMSRRLSELGDACLIGKSGRRAPDG
jgi:protein involved in polysaccharide export with SLBB domain